MFWSFLLPLLLNIPFDSDVKYIQSEQSDENKEISRNFYKNSGPFAFNQNHFIDDRFLIINFKHESVLITYYLINKMFLFVFLYFFQIIIVMVVI